MIRKPPSDRTRDDSAWIKGVQIGANAAKRGAKVARSGGHAAHGMFCFLFAALWGFAAIFGGLFAGSAPTFIGVGAMAAFMAWCGKRAFAKARAASA